MTGGLGPSVASASALAEVWGAQKVYVEPFDVRMLAGEIEATLAQRAFLCRICARPGDSARL